MTNNYTVKTITRKITFFRIISFLVLSVGILISALEFRKYFRGTNGPAINKSANDLYDPALFRLNSLDKMAAYSDSLYGSSKIKDSAKYAAIMGNVLRERFFHGFAYYVFGHNTIGWALAPLVHEHLSAIVLPNDILKHPSGGCSQQSIVGMELFRLKGYMVRKVSFYDSIKNVGHFCFEAKYGGSWHFFDPDKEPDLELLERHLRPSAAELVANAPLLDSLYAKNGGTDSNRYLFHVQLGPENTFPAKNARIYQITTKFLSMTLPVWLFLGLWFVRIQRRNRAAKN